MARPLRIEYAGAVYHITTRGNAREPIYRDDDDRLSFLAVLESVVKRYGWLCHAYCLMDNHYHLVIETPRPNLSRGMRQLNGVYTQKYNRAHQTVGHVFQGRYKAVLVQREAHLLELCRYVVLNPVRANAVSRPDRWKWSSYGATALSKTPPPFLFTDWVLQQFGRRRSTAQKAYRAFVREGIGAAPVWSGLVGQIALGTEEFAAQCRNRLGKREELAEVPVAQRQLGRTSLSDIFGGGAVNAGELRDELAYRACVEHEYRLKDVADHLGIHYTTVSRAVKRAEGLE